MKLREFIDFVQEQLAPLYPQQECKAMAVRLLKECIAGYKGYEHMIEPATELDTFRLEGHSGSTEEYLRTCVKRLAAGEPLQYVLGYEWFCGHRFNVAPGVLIPRPETEELVCKAIGFAESAQQVVQEKSASATPLRILDICTGSGCIAWSMAAVVPQAEVFACDISGQALKIARSQQIQCSDGSPAKVKFFECDILSEEAQQKIARECGEGKFNLIVSNPPYVCESEKSLMHPNVLEHEPSLALFVPDEDPLKFYRTIAHLSGRILSPGGALMFEINERFGKETAQMMQDMGHANCQVMQDLFGKERMVVGRL